MFTFYNVRSIPAQEVPSCVFGRHDAFAVIQPGRCIEIRSLDTGALMREQMVFPDLPETLWAQSCCTGSGDDSVIFAHPPARRLVEIYVFGTKKAQARVIHAGRSWHPCQVACNKTTLAAACRIGTNRFVTHVRVFDYVSGNVLRSVQFTFGSPFAFCVLPLSGDVVYLHNEKGSTVSRVLLAPDVDKHARVQLKWATSEHVISSISPCPSQDLVFSTRPFCGLQSSRAMFTFHNARSIPGRRFAMQMPDCVLVRHDAFAIIQPTIPTLMMHGWRGEDEVIEIRSLATGAAMCDPIAYPPATLGGYRSFWCCPGAGDNSIVFASSTARCLVEVYVFGTRRAQTRLIGDGAAWIPRNVACNDAVIVVTCDRAYPDNDASCIRVLDYMSGNVLRTVKCDCVNVMTVCILPLSGDVVCLRDRQAKVLRICGAVKGNGKARVHYELLRSDRDHTSCIGPCPTQDAVYSTRSEVRACLARADGSTSNWAFEEVEDVYLGVQCLPALSGLVNNNQMHVMSDGRILTRNNVTGTLDIIRDLTVRFAWIVVCLPRVARMLP